MQVGIAATLVHYLVIVLLLDLLEWATPTPATVVGSVFGIATAYMGNYLYVFGLSDRNHDHYAPRFIATYLTVMAIHAGMMYLFVDILNLRYEYGFVVATIFSATTTFIANHLVVFRPPQE
ncbi:GtrA family protein [Solemya velesiana gill symbiont]|uniref:GtrA family protein n=1 Tax=Solemya velesiana gill symbiont TaxID=1918948 RepID=UPI001560750C|nr:GtrA family protein [Solemya velesiana gill symbiont]